MTVSLTVVGLSEREQVAFGVFMGRSMSGWSWSAANVARGEAFPKADVAVVDLRAMGLAQWSEAAQAQLLEQLGGAGAVLLLPAHELSWQKLDAALAKQHALECVSKPYGTKDMQTALERVSAVVAQRAAKLAKAPVQAPQRSVDVPAVAVASVVINAPVAVVPIEVVPVVSENPLPLDVPAVDGEGEGGVAVAEFLSRLADPALADKFAFLRQLGALLEQQQPFEARFAMQNFLIVHPEHGWVATNTPMMVIERVCNSESLARAVEIRQIDDSQAEERLTQLHMAPRELELFLADLLAATLERAV
jgi:hypothetical protein